MTLDLETSEVLLRAFPGIPKLEAETMVASGEVCYYAPNTVLCHEGSIEHTFYIILEGAVQVTKAINGKESRWLTDLQAGDFFGEMALIHETPRGATVSTKIPSVVLEIHKDVFDGLLRRSPSVSVAMVREVSRRLRENDEMKIDDLRLKAMELANAYQQLAEQELARREFLAKVTSGLRTPLTVSTGFIKAIQTGIVEDDTLHSALDMISGNLDEMASLVNDILFLQEMDLILLDLKLVDMGSVVAAAVETQRGQAERNLVGLRLHIESDIPNVMADGKALERAILAVLDNAIKFSPNGGDVTIEVESEATDEVSQVRLVIRDHGVGIPQHALPYIFQRYYRVDQVGDQMFHGLGLGLSYARKVIEQLGGTITVESELGMGSAFTIRLEALQ